MLIDLKM